MKVDIKIKARTPIWTGGITKDMDRVHELGIIGSLRWWYAQIISRAGNDVKKCNFDSEKFFKAKGRGQSTSAALKEGGLCDVCQLFGATGWKRKFKLSIIEDSTQYAWDKTIQSLNIRPPDRKRGWYLPPGKINTFTLQVSGSSESIKKIVTLLAFLEKKGSIGSKPQIGYGIFKILNRPTIEQYITQDALPTHNNGDTDTNTLNTHWLFYKFRFRPSYQKWWTKVEGIQRLMGDEEKREILKELYNNCMVPIAPVIKNRWRFIHGNNNWNQSRWLYGYTTPKTRQRSNVAISWAYRDGNEWVVRGWSRFPNASKHLDSIDEFIKKVENERIWEKALSITKTEHQGVETIYIRKQSELRKFVGENI